MAPPSFAELFAAHHQSMVRLAGLLGADDPEDIAQRRSPASTHAGPGCGTTVRPSPMSVPSCAT
ncbi:hypothetical protein [Planomonospora venezuelensis]|uniref:Uncharacterized protein n=1 Tax=Planomonospora venezuelensis TaxID=1999 RepID=A0A841D7E8_PLAVE|nr:hypothetical protein [Planomonospora venezuelensis]MBB5964417.1 hypothetical protein [Planomonospora venezuelensis]